MELNLTIIDGIVFIILILSALLAMAQGVTREVLWIGSISLASIMALLTFQVLYLELFLIVLTYLLYPTHSI